MNSIIFLDNLPLKKALFHEIDTKPESNLATLANKIFIEFVLPVMMNNKLWTPQGKGKKFVENLTADVLTSSLIRHVLRFHDAKIRIFPDKSGFTPKFFFPDNSDFKVGQLDSP